MDMITVTKKWEPNHSNELWDEIIDWCVKQFGFGNSARWKTQATVYYMNFMFINEQDAELFILKWM